jgi:DMATS type aromatic prenyltransferase
MNSLASTQLTGISLGAFGRRKLRSLAVALDLSERLTSQALDVFGLMSESWGDWAVGDSPLWPNDISDDGTPFEFSASFDGTAPRLRMLCESQTEPLTRTSSWSAGLAFGERLKAEGLADLSAFEEVRDLFAPHPGARTRFSLWHAAVLEQDRPALFKAYVNPCLFGAGSAPYVVERALKRLGFADAWGFLEQQMAANPTAEIRYFSLDLEDPESARVKVYLGCSESAAAVDRLIQAAQNSRPEDAQHWLRTLTASQGPFDARPILSCFSFRRGLSAPDVTVHVPIRCYVKHDAEALTRVSQLMPTQDAERLSRALSAVSERPLNVGRGLLTYASLRREASAVRVTVYLAPEAYSITSRRPSLPPPSGFASGVHKTSPRSTLPTTTYMADVQALIGRHELLLRDQPLLRHLGQTGSVAQARLLADHIALVLLWLGDLSRFARERSTDSHVVIHLAERAADDRTRALRFMADLQAIGVSASAPPLFSEEHGALREVVFARVADVTAATDDRVRLAMVLAVSAISHSLLNAVVDFVARAVGSASETRPPLADSELFDEETQPQLSMIPLSDEVTRDVFTAVERCFESMLKVVRTIDTAVFKKELA